MYRRKGRKKRLGQTALGPGFSSGGGERKNRILWAEWRPRASGGEDDAEQTRKARKSQELSFDGSGLDELSEDGKGGWR